MFTRIKTPQEIAAMREGGHMLATVLDYVSNHLQAGITTQELSDMAAAEIAKLGAKPAFLGYRGFPAALCVSINDAVVHGIPSMYEVKVGDVVSLDFGVLFKDLITDAARTMIIGNDKRYQKLVHSTKQALDIGIKILKEGVQVGDVAAAIAEPLKKADFGIVRDLVGHGVGHELHEEPNLPNIGLAGTGPRLSANMTVALEPMVTMGDWRVKLDEDGWTVRTLDGSVAAHFEDTVLITERGSEILTRLQT